MDGKVGERMNKGFTDKIIKYLNIKIPKKDKPDVIGFTITDSQLIEIAKMLPETYNTKHNEAPSFKECIDIATKYPSIKFSGHIVGKRRADERVDIDAICIPIKSDYVHRKHVDLIVNLMNIYNPSEVRFENDYIILWWD
jgi:hypothetical protein